MRVAGSTPARPFQYVIPSLSRNHRFLEQYPGRDLIGRIFPLAKNDESAALPGNIKIGLWRKGSATVSKSAGRGSNPRGPVKNSGRYANGKQTVLKTAARSAGLRVRVPCRPLKPLIMDGPVSERRMCLFAKQVWPNQPPGVRIPPGPLLQSNTGSVAQLDRAVVF